VLSACETAAAEMMKSPDEVFSLSTVFLAAGSAGTVATLWSINDAAAALVVTRFYEELFNGSQPAQALRRAQLWLRDLTETEEAVFLAAHPEPEKEFQRRADQGRWPDLRSRTASQTPEPNAKPYAKPEFWAAFVLAGR
jgi:CHAT domain-containing protein